MYRLHMWCIIIEQNAQGSHMAAEICLSIEGKQGICESSLDKVVYRMLHRIPIFIEVTHAVIRLYSRLRRTMRSSKSLHFFLGRGRGSPLSAAAVVLSTKRCSSLRWRRNIHWDGCLLWTILLLSILYEIAYSGLPLLEWEMRILICIAPGPEFNYARITHGCRCYTNGTQIQISVSLGNQIFFILVPCTWTCLYSASGCRASESVK